MLSPEKNERLTSVGPGTPMGNLLRRYWWPVATHDMAGRVPVRRRLLGEDLVLFRDGEGRLGLLAEQCPPPPCLPRPRMYRTIRPAVWLPRLAVRRGRVLEGQTE